MSSTTSTSTTDFFVATTPPTMEHSIQGLREQIFGILPLPAHSAFTALTKLANTIALANAVALYPHIVCRSFQYGRTGVPQPQEMFDIIVTSSALDGPTFTYTAILVSGHALTRNMAARGPKATGLQSALEGLLHVTSEALGWYTETLLGEMKNQETTEMGVVDHGMVQEGFHFSHVQRAMAARPN